MPIVTAESHDLVVGSTHRLCAERILLEKALVSARKAGVPPWGLRRYVKRKLREVRVSRCTKDGHDALAAPCELCRAALITFDLRVSFTTAAGEVTVRRPEDLPPGVHTSAQKLGRHLN
ncbi:MAG: hypothetical protein GY704_09885 [Phycisphaeraceae bacterium]|jgi:hypothetical protein|nr:hypothetical protein [Phycisphaeraceae bacterium]